MFQTEIYSNSTKLICDNRLQFKFLLESSVSWKNQKNRSMLFYLAPKIRCIMTGFINSNDQFVDVRINHCESRINYIWWQARSIYNMYAPTWRQALRTSKKEERWKFVQTCIWWTIWKEMNNRSFQNVQNSIQKIRMNCLAHFYSWCKQDILARPEDVFDVLGCL